MENYRRPLETTAIMFMVGITTGFAVFEHKIYGPMAIFACSSLIICLVVFKRSQLIIPVLIGVLLFFINSQMYNIKPADKTLTISGICTDVNSKANSFILKDNSNTVYYVFNPKNVKVDDTVGRYIIMSGKAETAKKNTNPGNFNFNLYLKSRKINYIFQANNVKKGEISDKWSYTLNKYKEGYYKSCCEFMGKHRASLCSAILYGDKSNLDENTYEEFQTLGTAHVLATSGLHLGILYSFLIFLLGNKRSLKTNLVIALFIFIYLSFVGYSPSIVRASIMIYLHIISTLAHKPYDLISALSFSSIMILIINPYTLFNIGFQLSFLAVYLMGLTKKFFIHLPTSSLLKNTLLPILCLHAGLMPYTMYMFNNFNPVALIVNVPIIFMAGILLQLCFASLILEILFTKSSFLLFPIISKFSDLLIGGNKIFYDSNIGFTEVASPPICFVIAFYIFIWIFTNEELHIYFLRKDYYAFIRYFFISISVFMIISACSLTGFEGKDIIMLDVGQGAGFLIRTPSGISILIDGGGNVGRDLAKNTVKPALLRLGVNKIDYAIVTHLDEDHFGVVRKLTQNGMVKNMVFSGLHTNNRKKLSLLLNLNKKNMFFLNRGAIINFDKYTKLYTHSPIYNQIMSDDENANSLVFTVCINKINITLTGDISLEDEQKMLLNGNIKINNNNCNVLQIPHHGSKYSSSDELLACMPWRYAFIPVGKNHYGHPGDVVIKNLKKRHILIFRTDQHGAVGISSEEPELLPAVMSPYR